VATRRSLTPDSRAPTSPMSTNPVQLGSEQHARHAERPPCLQSSCELPDALGAVEPYTALEPVHDHDLGKTLLESADTELVTPIRRSPTLRHGCARPGVDRGPKSRRPRSHNFGAN